MTCSAEVVATSVASCSVIPADSARKASTCASASRDSPCPIARASTREVSTSTRPLLRSPAKVHKASTSRPVKARSSSGTSGRPIADHTC